MAEMDSVPESIINPLFAFIYPYSSAGPAQMTIDTNRSSEPFAVWAACLRGYLSQQKRRERSERRSAAPRSRHPSSE